MKLKLVTMFAAAVICAAIELLSMSGCRQVEDVSAADAHNEAYAAAKAKLEQQEPVEATRPELEPTPDPAFEEATDDPFLPPVKVAPIGPVSELYVLTMKECGENCEAVYKAARGVHGITFLDIDEVPDRARELCGGEMPVGVPCYVRVVDGKPVAKWLGRTDTLGLIRMRDGLAP